MVQLLLVSSANLWLCIVNIFVRERNIDPNLHWMFVILNLMLIVNTAAGLGGGSATSSWPPSYSGRWSTHRLLGFLLSSILTCSFSLSLSPLICSKCWLVAEAWWMCIKAWHLGPSLLLHDLHQHRHVSVAAVVEGVTHSTVLVSSSLVSRSSLGLVIFFIFRLF